MIAAICRAILSAYSLRLLPLALDREERAKSRAGNSSSSGSRAFGSGKQSFVARGDEYDSAAGVALFATGGNFNLNPAAVKVSVPTKHRRANSRRKMFSDDVGDFANSVGNGSSSSGSRPSVASHASSKSSASVNVSFDTVSEGGRGPRRWRQTSNDSAASSSSSWSSWSQQQQQQQQMQDAGDGNVELKLSARPEKEALSFARFVMVAGSRCVELP